MSPFTTLVAGVGVDGTVDGALDGALDGRVTAGGGSRGCDGTVGNGTPLSAPGGDVLGVGAAETSGESLCGVDFL